MSPTYAYVVKDWEGRTRQGTHWASNKEETLEYLRSQNLVIVDLKERPEKIFSGASGFSPIWERLRKKRPKSRDYMLLCRQFSTLIQAGMPVLQSLQILYKQTEHVLLRHHLKEVCLNVEKGGSLSESFKEQGEVFPRILINLVEAGEAGGILDVVMERLALHFEKQNDLEEKIRSATIYPVILTGAAVVVMSIMMFLVLPRFAGIFADMGVQLPWSTRVILGVSQFVIKYWFLVLGLGLGLPAGLSYYFHSVTGRERFDRLRLNLPLFGPVYRKTLVSRFSRTLGMLIASGAEIITSLELVEKVVDNKVLSRELQKTREVVRQGQPIASSLAASVIFPPLLGEMVHVGEESGSLDSMLSRIAELYESEVAYVVGRLGSTLEPVLIAFISLFVGLLVFSIITPLFQLYQHI